MPTSLESTAVPTVMPTSSELTGALGAADQCGANLRALVATYQLGTFKL